LEDTKDEETFLVHPHDEGLGVQVREEEATTAVRHLAHAVPAAALVERHLLLLRSAGLTTRLLRPTLVQCGSETISDLPKEIPGGQRAPELYDKSKILKLEAEAQKLREMIDKKEDAKRQKLREWDSLEREAETAQLRVDLAEGSLRNINGEADVSDAF